MLDLEVVCIVAKLFDVLDNGTKQGGVIVLERVIAEEEVVRADRRIEEAP